MEPPPAASDVWTTVRYRDWSAADAFALQVHPRWESLKDDANEFLASGDFERAVEGYTAALAVADGAVAGVGAFFDSLSAHPDSSSAAQQLVGAYMDIAPILRQWMGGPNAERGEPNKPAAICLANRAAVHIKSGRAEAALSDASAALAFCPEYLKGRHRQMQALRAVGADAAERLTHLQRQVDMHSELTRSSLAGAPSPGTWLGVQLTLVGWLDFATYSRVYEAPRCAHWRERAVETACSMAGTLRVHMSVLWGGKWLGLCFILKVAPSRPADEDDPEASGLNELMAALPPVPSIDYKYVRICAVNDDRSGQGQGAVTDHLDGEAVAALVDTVEEVVRELPVLTSLSLEGPLSDHAEHVRHRLSSSGLLTPRVPGRVLDGLDVCYPVGHCIKHARFGYRGVILSSGDHTCEADDFWIAQMGVDSLRRGIYQPWYHVLVDTRDRPGGQQCYVCHDNITLWIDPPDSPIRHPDLDNAFVGFDAARGRFVQRV